MYRIQVGRLAERQLDNALAWYAEQAPEQVPRLLASVSSAQSRIALTPFLSREIEPGLRRMALKVFPYHLWYTVDDDDVTIVAMTHFRQDTSYLGAI